MASSNRAPSRNGCSRTVCRRACSFSFTNTSGRQPPGECESSNRIDLVIMRAVVLLSGGLDSYTAAAIVKAEQSFELYALTIQYGQRHAREVESARAVARALEV